MRLLIRHETTYRFSAPATQGLQRLRLKPKDTHGQEVREWNMRLEGAKMEAQYDDHNHNASTLVSITPGATQVSITCTGIVHTADRSGIVGPHTGHIPLWYFLRHTPLTQPGPKARALVASLGDTRENPLDAIHRLAQAVRDAIEYRKGVTDAETTAEHALACGHGVCQDQTHALVCAGRLIGVPMRYVSGYLLMNDRIEQEAGHGWAEAHVEGLGWVGLDVTNGISPDERYVRVASGCDYREAAPVTGIAADTGEVSLGVAVSVREEDAATGQQTLQQRQQQQ